MTTQGYPSTEDIWRSTVRLGAEEAGEGDQGQAERYQREDWCVSLDDKEMNGKAYK
jgi:hypothetical protein